ncbi:Com family DNA-binding transcriptional regulator [Clostridium beijerinckii]|nr:Com family DNA-binding transcriptional regulator [Clostridium beijerinckii]NOW85580.1 phage FluMu protein Com [Clostridium beijerinckii]
MKDLRCPKCNKLILKYKLKGDFDVEFKCPRCDQISVTKLSQHE